MDWKEFGIIALMAAMLFLPANAAGVQCDTVLLSSVRLTSDVDCTASVFQNAIKLEADNLINSWNVSKTIRLNMMGGPYIGGNYWSDYHGKDRDRDGVGDTGIPHTAGGWIASGGDFFPLVKMDKKQVCLSGAVC